MLVRLDDRDDYGEERWVGVAPRRTSLHGGFIVVDDETVRMISLLRATNRENEHHEGQSRK